MSRAWSAVDAAWHGEGIAIVGMAGRFPRAVSVDEFWRNLCAGRDCISRMAPEELREDGVDDAMLRHERFVPAGGVLDGIELFDAAFFGISPREAESMDPQQRLFLEVVQHALDDAALDPERAPGPVGVYAGCRLSGYWLRLLNNPQFMATMGWHQVAAGNDKDFLPTQASFRFNLRGPSVNVQAACSTSLLATSLACDALIAGRCGVALAGAASVAVPHRTGYMFQPGGIASSDGTCRPFDAGATGSVLGNGVAVVVLKRVRDALASGDRIYAVIRSVALNNDGFKSSFTAPSIGGQVAVLNDAMRQAHVSPNEIGYIEAHGTATALGDPIEAEALSRVLDGANRDAPCAIGSVKSNIGHLDPAAGVASLIKVALSLHHEELPASLHFEKPNPAIDFARCGLRVVTLREPWKRGAIPRLAGVSAFGIGGTNVHAVLEEAPACERRTTDAQPELLIWSAKSASAVEAMTNELADHLAGDQSARLDDVARTLACGRRQFNHRRWTIASSGGEAVPAIRAARARSTPRLVKDRGVYLLFPGQGAQYAGMGAELYRTEEVFRRAVDEVSDLARPLVGTDLSTLVSAPAPDVDVNQTCVAQPLLFAVEYAAASLWMHWGIAPAGMLGHSVGELVAACIAGCISLADAVRVVSERGRLMQSMSPGAMLAIFADGDAVNAMLNDGLSISAYNAPRQQIVSGSTPEIDSLAERLRAAGVQCARLRTSHAFHHASMAGAADGLLRTIRSVHFREPAIPFISNVTGDWVTPQQATSPEYWASTVVRPVLFSQGARILLATPGSVLIECGPGRTLSTLLAAHRPDPDTVLVGTMKQRDDDNGDVRCARTGLGTVWQAGVRINWERVWAGREARRTKLPAYPFERKRFWIDARPGGLSQSPPQASHAPGPGGQPTQAPSSATCFVPVWQPTATPARAANGDATWLVLGDPAGLGSALCQRLKAAGQRAIVVLPGGVQSGTSEGTVTIDTDSKESMARLAEHADLSRGPVKMVNCLGVRPATEPPGIESAEHGFLDSFCIPLSVLRALRRGGRSIASFTAVGMRGIGGHAGEIPNLGGAGAHGLVRVIPQEWPGTTTRILDIPAPTSGHEAQAIVEWLSAELLSNAAEPVTALRAGARLVQTFVPTPIPPASAGLERLRAGGTYLITGGFGGIGGVLARVLASAGPARIALVGRRARATADDPSPRAVAERRLILDLERLGAVACLLAADIGDAAEAERAVHETRERLGPITGVVHAAGVPGGTLLDVMHASPSDTVLTPKLRGTVALLSSLAAHPPDFLVLCSSFASIAGGPGQGEYVAANAFLDIAAWYARAIGLPATSINWPAWREVGMVVDMSLPPELEPLRQASLDSGITPGEGADLFLSILASNLTQVVIPPIAGRRQGGPVGPMGPAPAPQPERRQAVAPSGSMQELKPGAGQDGLEAELRARLAGVWSQVLGVIDLKRDDNFFDLGGQSLMALQIVARIREQFPINVDLSDVFEHATLEKFASLIHTRLVEAIAAMPADKVDEMLSKA